MLKTITVTWTDNRVDAPFPGRTLCALWAGHGDDSELNDALAYAAKEARKRGVPVRVHTFATDDDAWRAKSVAAHVAGNGL